MRDPVLVLIDWQRGFNRHLNGIMSVSLNSGLIPFQHEKVFILLLWFIVIQKFLLSKLLGYTTYYALSLILLLYVYVIKCVDTSQWPSSPFPFGYYLTVKLGETWWGGTRVRPGQCPSDYGHLYFWLETCTPSCEVWPFQSLHVSMSHCNLWNTWIHLYHTSVSRCRIDMFRSTGHSVR